jgi:hypothetical protein
MANMTGLREAVLEELEAIAEGQCESAQDQMVWRFLKWEDWQRASHAVQRSLSAEKRNPQPAFLSPPAGWPPLQRPTAWISLPLPSRSRLS